jgi:hypothetical protein
MSTTDLVGRLHPVARWRLGLSLGQVLRTVAWGTATVFLLWWWASAGVYLASDLLEAVVSTPHARQELLAYLGGLYIGAKLIAGPLYRRVRWRSVRTTVPTGVAVPTGRPSGGSDDLWSLERRARHEAAHAVACTWAGDRVALVDIESVGHRGGRIVPEHAAKALPDHAWGRLVTLVAGQLVDAESGAHDYGASNDMAQALEAVASILSTGQRPTGYVGELATDALFTAARQEAAAAIAEHSDVFEALVAALVADPARPLRGPALESLLEPITRTPGKEAS